MVLAIDIGNTNMEFGIFVDNTLRYNFRMGTSRDVTSDEVGVFIVQFFNIHNIKVANIKAVIIASVVPQTNYSVTNAVKKYIGKNPIYVQEDLSIDIKNMYDNEKEVGADRLVNAYAAYRKYGKSLIVVDFGTATTFDVVGKSGEYMGGVIYPGIKISVEALYQRTAKLKRFDIAAPNNVIGKNTVDSLQSGIIYGYVGSVKNIVENICDTLNENVIVIATGGLSGIINKYYKFDYLDKTLVLEGLNMIYMDSL